MKKTFFLLLFVIIVQKLVLTQTFRNGFDQLETSASANFGNGTSLFSNVNNYTHNIETAYIQGYLNMFIATKDKRYLDKFIIHVKRIQERRDDNIHNIPDQLLGFPANIVISDFPCDNGCTIQGISQVPSSSKAWSYVEETCFCLYNTQAVVQSGEITYPMAQFVYFMQTDPEFMLYANEFLPTEATQVPACNTCPLSTYQEFADWLQIRIMETINHHSTEWTLDEQLGKERYINENLNGQSSLGRTIAMMYLVTGDAILHLRLTAIALLIHGELVEGAVSVNGISKPYYTWTYSWNGTTIEDATHAYLTMEFAEICSRYNIRNYLTQEVLFDVPNMIRFANTFAHKMYKTPLSFWSTTAGNNNDDFGGNATSAAYYAFLAKYNPYIFQIISDLYAEDAIYNDGGHLKALSQLALLQSTNNYPYTLTNESFKFNPIAVRRLNTPASDARFITGGDFNNDGLRDFAFIGFSDGICKIYSPDICDNPNETVNCWLIGASPIPHLSHDWKGIAGGDFNTLHAGDEIMTLNATSGKIYYYQKNSSSVIEQNLEPAVAHSWAGLTSGNFDGIAGDEAIAITTDGDAYMIKYAGSLQEPVFICSLKDLNNVGISQSIGVTAGHFEPSNPNLQIATLDNNNPDKITVFSFENGTFTATYEYDSGNGNLWTSITSGDFDGDGLDELAAHRDKDGVMRILKIKNGSLQGVYDEYFPVDQSIRAISTGKFKNSLGKESLIVLRNFDGQITLFNLDGQCPDLLVNDVTVNEAYTIDNDESNAINNYTLDYHANNNLYSSDFILEGGNSAEFIAGNAIFINPGTDIVASSDFYAHIDPGFACQSPHFMPQINQPQSQRDDFLLSKQPAETQKTIISNIKVYPNPSSDKIYISFDQRDLQTEIVIHSMDGRIVKQLSSKNIKEEIDLTEFEKGIYTIRFFRNKLEIQQNRIVKI